MSIISHQDYYTYSKNLKHDNIYDREFLRNLNRKRDLYQRLEEPFKRYKARITQSQTPDLYLISKTPQPEVSYSSQLKPTSSEHREVVYQKTRNSQKLSKPRVRVIIPKVIN